MQTDLASAANATTNFSFLHTLGEFFAEWATSHKKCRQTKIWVPLASGRKMGP